jgi:hypothetical protein
MEFNKNSIYALATGKVRIPEDEKGSSLHCCRREKKLKFQPPAAVGNLLMQK